MLFYDGPRETNESHIDQKCSLQIPLMDKEFSYSVDVSNVGCHCNAAAYFIDMPGKIQHLNENT